MSDQPRRVRVVVRLGGVDGLDGLGGVDGAGVVTSGAAGDVVGAAGEVTVRSRQAAQPPVAPGTGTEARIARTTSSAVTPRNWASGATSKRCSSTGWATRFTSSGST